MDYSTLFLFFFAAMNPATIIKSPEPYSEPSKPEQQYPMYYYQQQQQMAYYYQYADYYQQQQQQQQQQVVQPREYKRPKKRKPQRSLSNPAFFCSPCNKGFGKFQTYDAHLKAHQKCAYCNFSALPKFVSMHYQEAHQKRVPLVDSQEDIDAYIKARKRKYPTEDNIIKRISGQPASEESADEVTNDTTSDSETDSHESLKPKERVTISKLDLFRRGKTVFAGNHQITS
jgi:hypothetical protein